MPITYVNRKGDNWQLFVGKTKSGKPKYYVSKKAASAGGIPVERLPEGYELHESPVDAIVHVRKIRPSRITAAERTWAIEQIRRITEQTHFFVEIDGDALVVYWPNQDSYSLDRMCEVMYGDRLIGRSRVQEYYFKHGTYEPCFRFTLVDGDDRLYATERMCYRGGEEHWWPLSYKQPLEEALSTYAPHLGEESFFDLI